MSQHATPAELELYVLGAMVADRVDSFEAHCAGCEACAARLSDEAKLEMVLEQVSRRAVRVQAIRPARALAYGAAGLVAMAAVVLLWVGHGPGPVGTGGEAASVSRAPLSDGAILDARNDALDGG